MTVTVADWSAVVCPLPVHWKVKVVLENSWSVSPLPERVPELDHGPPAVQEDALVELHVRVERPAYATDVGEAERVAVGAGLASEQEAVLPPFSPSQDHVQELAPSTLLALVPAEQE